MGVRGTTTTTGREGEYSENHYSNLGKEAWMNPLGKPRRHGKLHLQGVWHRSLE